MYIHINLPMSPPHRSISISMTTHQRRWLNWMDPLRMKVSLDCPQSHWTTLPFGSHSQPWLFISSVLHLYPHPHPHPYPHPHPHTWTQNTHKNTLQNTCTTPFRWSLSFRTEKETTQAKKGEAESTSEGTGGEEGWVQLHMIQNILIFVGSLDCRHRDGLHPVSTGGTFS